jgi:hypothetical protein
MSRSIQPDWAYLLLKLDIDNKEKLKAALLMHCTHISMDEMANDVAPFLFNPADRQKIIHFPALVRQYWQ